MDGNQKYGPVGDMFDCASAVSALVFLGTASRQEWKYLRLAFGVCKSIAGQDYTVKADNTVTWRDSYNSNSTEVALEYGSFGQFLSTGSQHR